VDFYKEMMLSGGLYYTMIRKRVPVNLHELGLGVEDFTRVVTGAIDVMSDRNAPGA
jgi:hypothetical protein